MEGSLCGLEEDCYGGPLCEDCYGVPLCGLEEGHYVD